MNEVKEVMCTNSVFPLEYIDFYKKNNIKTPKLKKIYTIREIITHTTGKKGILLNEIVNPLVTINHPILGNVNVEVTWDIRRFSTLLGDRVEIEEQIEETI